LYEAIDTAGYMIYHKFIPAPTMSTVYADTDGVWQKPTHGISILNSSYYMVKISRTELSTKSISRPLVIGWNGKETADIANFQFINICNY